MEERKRDRKIRKGKCEREERELTDGEGDKERSMHIRKESRENERERK